MLPNQPYRIYPASSSPMIILDEDATWDGRDGNIVHWADMDVPDGHISIPKEVDDRALSLREEYLKWVHDLGEHQVGGKTLREHLKLDERFSFWWMTLIAEKSPIKSKAIYTLFKLRTLENLYFSSGSCGIKLYSSDEILHEILSEWCQKIGHSFYGERFKTPSDLFNVRQLFYKLPHLFQVVIFLLKKCWGYFSKFGKVSIVAPSGCHQITIVTNFPNIDQRLAEQGVFRSRYWEDLHDFLIKGKFQVNWVWIYSKSKECSFRRAVKLRSSFDENAQGKASHYFLEEFFSMKDLLRALRLYFHLLISFKKLKPYSSQFYFTGSFLDFFKIFEQDWKSSLLGTAALEGCFMMANFHGLAKQLPHQDIGVYLWENQPWERALIWAWKNCGHGKIVGFQHALLKTLNMRFFEDQESYQLKQYPPIIPDVLAVGGERAYRQLSEAGFPKDNLKLVEALRFMYLVNDREQKNDNSKGGKVLLAITGYNFFETLSQLTLLSQASIKGILKKTYDQILIKPHPFCPVDKIISGLFFTDKVTIINTPLKDIWSSAPMVYAANSTSASVEAMWNGLETMIHVPTNSINLSPLYDLPYVKHIRNIEEFKKGLNASRSTDDFSNFFCLKKELPRWTKLIKSI